MLISVTVPVMSWRVTSRSTTESERLKLEEKLVWHLTVPSGLTPKTDPPMEATKMVPSPAMTGGPTMAVPLADVLTATGKPARTRPLNELTAHNWPASSPK